MNKNKPFILYWFVCNGWSKVHGRYAKCCQHCSHCVRALCTEGGCDYCDVNNIQVRSDLVCDNFDWKLEDRSIFD